MQASALLLDILHASLIKHEGLRLTPYKDTNGHLTIGVGHNLDDGISNKTAMQMLDDDIAVAKAGALKLFPNLLTFSLKRQAAIIELIFNMGEPTFSKFTTTIACIHAGAWSKAAENLLDSTWAKQVGGGRSNDIADMLRTG